LNEEDLLHYLHIGIILKNYQSLSFTIILSFSFLFHIFLVFFHIGLIFVEAYKLLLYKISVR